MDVGIAACIAVLIVDFVLLDRGIDLVAEWLYLLTWVPVLALLDLLVRRLGGESLLARRDLGAMVWWSAVIWLVFEAVNLRIQNWYYVNVPRSLPLRWLGTLVAFGTVVPAVFLPERLLARAGAWRRLRGRPMVVRRGHMWIAFAAGWVMLAAVIACPRAFFPLTWGAVWFIADPLLYRRRPDLALIGDLTRGDWSRITRLLVAGLIAGGIWEGLNIGARTKWIYTVPYLEEIKLFEMPLFGFVGFTAFALEIWSVYHLLRLYGRHMKFVVSSVIFALLVLAGMDRWTVSSTRPRVAELPGVTEQVAERLAAAGVGDVFQIAQTPPAEIRGRTRLDVGVARRVHEGARLAALRGIGAKHAAALVAGGIPSVEALARAQPGEVWAIARRPGDARPTRAEVRVWLRAAREHAGVSRVGGDGDR